VAIVTAPRVSLVRCDDYELERVEAAVRRAVDLLGGMAAFVQPGQRVLLKPNLVRPAAPDRAVSTHPTVVAAVARLVAEAGGRAVIVESPGGPYSPGVLRSVYRRTGMDWAAEVSGAELNQDTSAQQVSVPEGVALRLLDLVQPALEADAIINLPKLKTHNLTTLTLAVKNLFGLVPGAIKIGYHAKMPDRRLFSQGMLDILTYLRPALNVMDAVVAMEGNGPSGGDPRQVSAMLASPDALALDVAAAALVGFDPTDVSTTEAAVERGLTSGRVEDLELVGDPLGELRVAGFRRGINAAIDPGLLPVWAARLLGADGERRTLFEAVTTGWLGKQLVAYPRAGNGCTGCGFCAQHCPVNAITVVGGRARMDTRVCIRCYCCHELCPENAVELRRTLLGRLLSGG
jgi:uncharacterized protein (DUF362 family)/ferredoxin